MVADRETPNLLDTAGEASDEQEDSVAATSDSEAELRASNKLDRVDQLEDMEAPHESKMNLEEEERHHRTEDSNLKDGTLGMPSTILGAISELVHAKVVGSSLPILGYQDYQVISWSRLSLVNFACRQQWSTCSERVVAFLLSAPRW